MELNQETWYLGLRVDGPVGKLTFAKLGELCTTRELAKSQYCGVVARAYCPACVAVLSSIDQTFEIRDVLCEGEWEMYNPHNLGCPTIVELRDFRNSDMVLSVYSGTFYAAP